MKDGKKAAIGLGIITVAVVGVILATRKAEAAPPPPPGGYVCPYCGDSFSTYAELVAHVQSVHPGERIPLEITWQ